LGSVAFRAGGGGENHFHHQSVSRAGGENDFSFQTLNHFHPTEPNDFGPIRNRRSIRNRR